MSIICILYISGDLTTKNLDHRHLLYLDTRSDDLSSFVGERDLVTRVGKRRKVAKWK